MSDLVEKIGARHLAHFPIALRRARHAKPFRKLIPLEPEPLANPGNAGRHIGVNKLSGHGSWIDSLSRDFDQSISS